MIALQNIFFDLLVYYDHSFENEQLSRYQQNRATLDSILNRKSLSYYNTKMSVSTSKMSGVDPV